MWTFIIEEGYGKRNKEEGGPFTALATLCLLDLRRRWTNGGFMSGLDGWMRDGLSFHPSPSFILPFSFLPFSFLSLSFQSTGWF